MSYDIDVQHRASVTGGHNYTYNLARFFRDFLGGDGINDLDGLDAREAAERISVALERIEAFEGDLTSYDAPNGWGSAEGATAFLREIRQSCREYEGVECCPAKVWVS
jgi:hypothetical protein